MFRNGQMVRVVNLTHHDAARTYSPGVVTRVVSLSHIDAKGDRHYKLALPGFEVGYTFKGYRLAPANEIEGE